MQILVPDEFQYLYVQNKERPVVKIPAEVLRRSAAPVERITKQTLRTVDEMIRVMRKANGVGLAGPQLAISQRIFVMEPSGMKPQGFINPVIIRGEGDVDGEEGCLSIPGLYGNVRRFEYVEMEALDTKGRLVTLELEGMPARIAQHEIDHLDGVLFIDKVDQATLHWRDPDALDEE